MCIHMIQSKYNVTNYWDCLSSDLQNYIITIKDNMAALKIQKIWRGRSACWNMAQVELTNFIIKIEITSDGESCIFWYWKELNPLDQKMCTTIEYCANHCSCPSMRATWNNFVTYVTRCFRPLGQQAEDNLQRAYFRILNAKNRIADKVYREYVWKDEFYPTPSWDNLRNYGIHFVHNV